MYKGTAKKTKMLTETGKDGMMIKAGPPGGEEE